MFTAIVRCGVAAIPVTELPVMERIIVDPVVMPSKGVPDVEILRAGNAWLRA